MCIMFAALSLTVLYSIRNQLIVASAKPTTVAEWRELSSKYEDLRCSCGTQTSVLSRFATVNITVTPTCEWVKEDLKQGANGGTNGACAKLGKSDMCKLVNAACSQAAITRLWIESEFNNTIIATPELIRPRSLNITANKTLESSIQIGKIIAAGPQKTIDRWASANMPKVLEVIGGLTDRIRVLSLKQNRDDKDHEDDLLDPGNNNAGDPLHDHLAANPSHTLDSRCTLGSGSSECRWDYFVNQCLAASSGACNPYKVGDGVCDEGCMKYAECYRDAGDCLGIQIGKAFEEEEHTFPSGATITVADYKPFDKYFAEEKRDSSSGSSGRRRRNLLFSWSDDDDDDSYGPSDYGYYNGGGGHYDYPPGDHDHGGGGFYGFPGGGDYAADMFGGFNTGYDYYWQDTSYDSSAFDWEFDDTSFATFFTDIFSTDTDGLDSWLDAPDKSYSDSTSKVCNVPSNWTKAETLEANSELRYLRQYKEINDLLPPGVAMPRNDFAPSGITSCDQNVKDLDTATFNFATMEKLKTFYDEMIPFLEELKDNNALAANQRTTVAEYLEETKTHSNFDLKFTIPLESQPHGSLRRAIENIFMDEVKMEVDYEDYFEVCRISSCAYTFKGKLTNAALGSLILGLLGGISTVMASASQALYILLKFLIIQKNKSRVAKLESQDEKPAEEGAFRSPA